MHDLIGHSTQLRSRKIFSAKEIKPSELVANYTEFDEDTVIL